MFNLILMILLLFIVNNNQKGPYVGDLHYAVLLQALLAGNNSDPIRFLDFSAPIYDRYTNACIGVLAAHMKYPLPLPRLFFVFFCFLNFFIFILLFYYFVFAAI
jgi:hypothetical protein